MHETERLMTPPPELYTTSGRTRITGRLALIALCLAAVSPLGASDKRLTPILEDLPISSAQKTPQQTPIAHTSDPTYTSSTSNRAMRATRTIFPCTP